MTTPSTSISPFERETYDLVTRREIAYAIAELGGAMHERMDGRVEQQVGAAIRHLTQFLGNVKPAPTLSEADAAFSQAAHTYMRKCWDSPLSTLLYRLISDSKGFGVWAAFCQGAVVHGMDLREALETADIYYDDHSEDSDNLVMLCALRLWPAADFKRMAKAFKEDGWL